MRTRSTAPRRPRGSKQQTPPTEVVVLRNVQAPERFDHPELGAQERVDPVAAVRRILAAHKAVHGNSTHAARMMGVTYQGLRRAILRFSLPRLCADGVLRMVLVDVGDDGAPQSVDDAVRFLRTKPNLDALEAEARTLITNAVADRVRLVDIARAANIDPTRLTKFRSRTGPLSLDEIGAIQQAVHDLRTQPVAHRSGRRAAA